jgi:ATP-dependent protease ClpP protease subunit
MNVYPMKCRIRAVGSATRVDVYDDIGGGDWLFGGGISAGDFAGQLAAVAGPLDVHINSYGGDVDAGITIGNIIRGYSGRKRTVVDGFACSIASVILQAGDERVMQPGSMVMIHDAMSACVGSSADMQEAAATLDKHSDNIANIYAARAGGTPQQWRATMRSKDTWYTADEAVAAGLADRVGDGEAHIPAGVDVGELAAMVPGRIAAALRMMPRAAASTADEHGHPGQPCWDPDGDGDCDATPEGDTDHDYWAPDGTQKKPVPGKPMEDALTAQIRAVFREELAAAGLRAADKYKQADRDRMAKSGEAMEDGSYPIADAEDLDKAIHAVGQGGADHDAIRKHIIGRAAALGLSSQIPDNWNADGSMKDLSETDILAMFAGAIQLGAGKE